MGVYSCKAIYRANASLRMGYSANHWCLLWVWMIKLVNSSTQNISRSQVQRWDWIIKTKHWSTTWSTLPYSMTMKWFLILIPKVTMKTSSRSGLQQSLMARKKTHKTLILLIECTSKVALPWISRPQMMRWISWQLQPTSCCRWWSNLINIKTKNQKDEEGRIRRVTLKPIRNWLNNWSKEITKMKLKCI
mgnify:FL=1